MKLRATSAENPSLAHHTQPCDRPQAARVSLKLMSIKIKVRSRRAGCSLKVMRHSPCGQSTPSNFFRHFACYFLFSFDTMTACKGISAASSARLLNSLFILSLTPPS